MTSSAAKAPMLADLGAEPVVADALDADALTRAVARRAARRRGQHADPDPGQARRGRRSMRATNELRERGVRHLLDAAVAAGARRFVSESFFGVYGFGPYERPRTEDDPIGRERNRGVQAVIDAIASSEGQVRAASDEQRIEGVSLRFAAFHGPLAPNTADDGRARAQAPAAGRRRPRRDDADGRARRRRPRRGRRARARARRADLQRRRRRAGGDGRLPDRARARRRRAAAAPRARTGSSAPPAPYIATFMGRARVPMSNARIADELGWRPRYPTYREALALLDPSVDQPPNRPRRASTLAT